MCVPFLARDSRYDLDFVGVRNVRVFVLVLLFSFYLFHFTFVLACFMFFSDYTYIRNFFSDLCTLVIVTISGRRLNSKRQSQRYEVKTKLLVRVARSLVFCVMFSRSLFALLFFFFWLLCCLFFFDLQILITSLWGLLALLTLDLYHCVMYKCLFTIIYDHKD